jgi:hypothetical protein
MIGATDSAAAIDEGIEHQVDELVAELETDLLRAGCGFARKLIQATGEIAAGGAEQRHEILAEPYGLLRSTESGPQLT